VTRENVFSIIKPNNQDNFVHMYTFALARTALEGAGEFH